MAYKPSSLVQRVWSAPPQCLADLRVEPLREPPSGATKWGDDLAVFQVACLCGSKSFHILGYPHPEATFLCPLAVQCAHCSRVAPLFDIEKHGYDAALGNGCWSIRGSGAPQRWVCPQCPGAPFAAYPKFSYQVDEVEDFDPEQRAHIQDFFDWFQLDVRCDHCSALIEMLVDYECA